MTIYFLIPLYNEELNVGVLAQNLQTCLPEDQKFYLFVDDASTDNTVALLKQYFQHVPSQILTKARNQGPGDSFNLGFEWILNHSTNDSDIVVTLEGDNTSDLKILPNMLAISRLGYSLVLASVYAQGGGFSRTSLFRKVLSFGANLLLRFLFNINVLTLSSFYRVYHLSLLAAIKHRYPQIISEKGFISMIEILVKAIHLNAAIIEVPMVLSFEKRQGKSKMKIFRTMLSYIKFLSTSRKFKIH